MLPCPELILTFYYRLKSFNTRAGRTIYTVGQINVYPIPMYVIQMLTSKLSYSSSPLVGVSDFMFLHSIRLGMVVRRYRITMATHCLCWCESLSCLAFGVCLVSVCSTSARYGG